MGRLSKREIKVQQPLLNILNTATTFTSEQRKLIYSDFNEQMIIGDIASTSSFYTPWELALDFALLAPMGDGDVVVDMCAGIGCLSYATACRYNNLTQIAIEFNPTAVNYGRKLLPWVDWYCGSIFDCQIWDEIESKHGKIDCIISNPPFGRNTKIDNRSMLRYTGNDFEMAAIDLALQKSESQAFILPQSSCDFRASCEGWRFDNNVPNNKLDKLWKDIGHKYVMNWMSIDTRVYGEFKNTKIVTECVDFFYE